MTMSIFMATLMAFSLLLGDVMATVVVTAPSTLTEERGTLETREQGPTAWICTVLVEDSPWTAYATIRGYLEGGNAERKNYSDLVLYPVMELFHSTQNMSRLCVFLPSEDHCYPPAPNTVAVKAVKQLKPRTYFAMRFWGQASNARVQFYRQKLTTALTTSNKAVNLDLFFVSYFSGHVREVRYDPAMPKSEPSNDLVMTRSSSPGPKQETPMPQCPARYETDTLHVGNDTYTKILVDDDRLNMMDVQRRTTPDNASSIDFCGITASKMGYDGFWLNMRKCTYYNFGKDFCPCNGPGALYVNRERLEKTEGRWQVPPYHNQDLELKVIHAEIPLVAKRSSGKDTTPCERALLKPGAKPLMSAVFEGDICYVSLFHDVLNCNKPCKGEPRNALVRKKEPYDIVYFLSQCGKTIQISAKFESESSIYLSHPGTGCVLYPEPKTAEEEDCLITFKKSPTAKSLEVVFDYVNIDRKSTKCGDKLDMYAGPVADGGSKLNSLCYGEAQRIRGMGVVTINFNRKRNFEGDGRYGFRLSVFNVPKKK